MAGLPALEELLSLKGKRAMISGAAAGIGRAIAYRFAEAGAALHLVDMNEKRLALAKNELAGSKAEIHAHVTDLCSQRGVGELWDSLNGTTPDVLVNVAGIYPIRPFVSVDESFYHRVMDVNLSSVHWMCQEMIRRRRKKGGVIINTGSIEAILPFKDGLVHYSMSKAGVIALTRALAKEYARHGFRINALLPGGIVTQGTRAVANGIFRFRLGLIKTGMDFAQRLPIGRLGQPDEVACMALVLASGLASYVHGAVIPVDGGFLAA